MALDHIKSTNEKTMNRIRITASLVILAALMIVETSATAFAQDSGVKHDVFKTEEILDESTLDIKILQDWHVDEVTGTTRQKLVEINVAQWWPGQDYRIPVRLIVPLEGKAKGFHITGGNSAEFLSKDICFGHERVSSPLSPIELGVTTEREMPKTLLQEVFNGQLRNRRIIGFDPRHGRQFSRRAHVDGW